MSHILGDIPFFRCLVRKEYTRDMADGQGQYIEGIAHAVRVTRGNSLWFQVNFKDPYGGCAFTLPIEALVWKECPDQTEMTYVQPWDCFSDTFSVHEMAFVKRATTYILPERVKAEYRFTIDFTGSDLADDPAQHKALHLCFLENGLIGAFPNNRVLWEDRAFWDVRQDRPDFDVLNQEFRAEGPRFRRVAKEPDWTSSIRVQVHQGAPRAWRPGDTIDYSDGFMRKVDGDGGPWMD